MPRQRGEPKPRYRVPGKGQPAYLEGDEAEAARAADRSKKAAVKIRDRPTPAQILGKPVKTKVKSKPRAKPAPSRPAVGSGTAARAPAVTAGAGPAASPTPTASAPSGYAGSTPQQLAAQARAQIAAILGPQIASTNTAYQNQGAGLNAAYGAVAQMQEGIAPAIQGTYDAASARQAVIGKGYADGFKMASEGAAEGLNSLLDPGSPQTITPAGQSGANALYGLGGALPAGELNAQGAAFASAAEYLPMQSRQLGLDSLKASELGRVQAVRELQAQRPKLMQDALAGLQGAEAQKEALSINRAIAAREGYIDETGQTPEGNWTFDSRMKIIQTTGVDPVTGQRVQKVVDPKVTSPKERRDAIAFANSTAAEAFNGVYAKDGSPVSERVPYQTALFDLMNAGTPLAIAQRALDRFWKQSAKGVKVEMITIGKRRIPFLYFPEWETPGQGRPLVPIQSRGKRK
ncbi:MAG: hypothetical protein NUW01_13050 [Gemmatimonadaceae bacterium]|nr:hypothetical protein [Gemmatimonadaceae bacterium]